MSLMVSIYLGSNCNMNCKYCHREKDLHEGQYAPKLIDKLKSLKGITRINFMGGEPTLYMGTIKKVVKEFPRGVEFRVTTNGKLLKENIEFFREHGFYICVSYDGNNNLRGYDPFTKPLDYPKLVVSTTICHGNTDFSKIIHDFAEKEKVLHHQLNFYPHLMHCTSESNSPLALTADDYDSILKQWRELVEKHIHDLFIYGVINHRSKGLFEILKGRYDEHYSFGETYCISHRKIKMDYKGDTFTCLYIRDTEPSNVTDEIIKKNLNCKDCSIYDMCGGGCVKEKHAALECHFYKRLFSWFKKRYEEYREGASC